MFSISRAKLSNLIPTSALAKHVFLGFTYCGRFFLSYTEDEVRRQGGAYDDDEFESKHLYTLHWWSYYRIGCRAVKVRELVLFGGERQPRQLVMTISQSHYRYLIVGTPSRIEAGQSTIKCVAQQLNFENDDVQKGTLTSIILEFPLQQPFPRHEAAVMDRDHASIIINTGSSLCIVRIAIGSDSEFMLNDAKGLQRAKKNYTCANNSMLHRGTASETGFVNISFQICTKIQTATELEMVCFSVDQILCNAEKIAGFYASCPDGSRMLNESVQLWDYDLRVITVCDGPRVLCSSRDRKSVV